MAGVYLVVAKPPAVDGDVAAGPPSETRERPGIIGPALVLGAMLAYVSLSEIVGFLPIGILILVCLLVLGGMRIVLVTFYMDPVPAVAMFAGDIPSALLRRPGTPASVAYTDDAYALTKKGMAHVSLGICLLTSAIGGIFGAHVLSVFAPPLAMVALKFSSFEYFWLCMLGLTTSAFIMQGSPVKGIISLSLGLCVSTIGIDPVSGVPRFTFGSSALIGGVSLVPVMIGVFAVAEIFRFYARSDPKLALE